jgi:SAM-dependent methyltransferase
MASPAWYTKPTGPERAGTGLTGLPKHGRMLGAMAEVRGWSGWRDGGSGQTAGAGWSPAAWLHKARRAAIRAPGARHLAGSLDQPGPVERFTGWARVSGWALARDGGPVVVRARLPGRLLEEQPPTLDRPDVHRLYPGHPRSATSGFAFVVRAEALPATGVARLLVEAVTDGPRPRRRTLGSLRLARQVAPALPRAAYQQAWDHVSGSRDTARTAVCGTADQAEYDRSGEETARFIIEAARVTPTDAVLEIGCGTGRVGAKLAPRCGRWIGADVSQNMLRHAADALGSQPNVRFHHLNGVDLAGLDDRSLDVVYCSGVFMHLDEWDRYRYVVEAYRVLRPGGRVCFDSFNLLTPEGWALFEELYALDPSARPPNISKASTPPELRAYAEHAGFQEIRLYEGGLWVAVAGIKPAGR